jgi:hypothetical protein
LQSCRPLATGSHRSGVVYSEEHQVVGGYYSYMDPARLNRCRWSRHLAFNHMNHYSTEDAPPIVEQQSKEEEEEPKRRKRSGTWP